MIKSVRHRGLKRLVERNDASRLSPQLVPRINRSLTVQAQAAGKIDDVALPGFGLHPLSGDLAGFWSVRVSGNWRVVFRLDAGQVFDVDLFDCH